MKHLLLFSNYIKENLSDFEDQDLTIRKPEETIIDEPIVNDKEFDPTKDKFSTKKKDFTQDKYKSIASAVKPVIEELNALLLDKANQVQNFKMIQKRFLEIVNDLNVNASPQTRRKWTMSIEKAKSLLELSYMMTNLYLAAADLKVGTNKFN